MLRFFPLFNLMLFFSPCLFQTCGLYYFVYPGPSETFRRRNLCVFLLLYFTLCPFVTKRGSNFYLGRDCIFNRSSDFCPRMAKEGVC
jgi:hypothetical protein